MPIKVTETITRDCCEVRRDLNPYKGRQANKGDKYMFCKHCGQIWEWDRRMDAAGSMEDYLRPVCLAS